jgi:hypothetical protein
LVNQKKNSKQKKKIPNLQKSMSNPYFGIWTRPCFYQKPGPLLIKITSWNWTINLVPVLKPSKIGGQFKLGSKTWMKPLGNPIIQPTLVCTLRMFFPSLVNMHSTHSCRFCEYAINTCNIWRFGHYYFFISHLC